MDVSPPPANPTPIDTHQNSTIAQLLASLKSSASPKARQWAAQALSASAEPTPTVLQALASGASADSSNDVRDACLHGLLHFGVADPAVLAQVDWPQMDEDPHVREAAWRLVLFGTEASGTARVREAAKTLKQWFQSQSPGGTPGRS
jgi:hypothetical protein